MNVFQQLLEFLGSPYLRMWWYLFAGYIGCWLVALAIAALRPEGMTIIYASRQAWAWAFIVHLLFTFCFTAFWWKENNAIKSFYTYVPFYVVLVILDIFLIIRIRAGLGNFRSYHRSE